MGFSVTSSTVVLAVAAFTMGGALASAFLTSYDKVSEAYREDWDFRRDQARTNITITSVSWNNGQKQLTFNIKNTGATVLDPNQLEFVIDGRWKTNKVTSLTIGGVSTTVWAPGETLVAVVQDTTWTSQPSRREIVTENGIATWG
ncbi:MAG TPA: hypothetical protein VM889_07815 [Candidatus Thermoplasmatota archaeon]|nr:hypothetical protein [Candidatus Thermoplasmatota archaeon]